MDIFSEISENLQATSAVKFSVSRSLPTLGLLIVNSSRLEFSPDSQNTEELPRGDLQE